MKTISNEKILLFLIIILGSLAAFLLCGIRMGIEADNNRVCIAMGEDDLLKIAYASGLPDAESAANAIGVTMMAYDSLRDGGILVEDGGQYSYLPQFGAYLPERGNTRAFLAEGEYASRYATLGCSDAQPITDMLYRAVTDRNIRLVYLRLFETPDGRIITDAAEYGKVTSQLSERISAHGLKIADHPSAIVPYAPGAAARYLAALGVAAAALLLLQGIFPSVPKGWIFGLLGLAAVAAGVLLWFFPGTFTVAFSFAASVVSPCFALRLMLLRIASAGEVGRAGAVRRFITSLLVGFAAALLGGLTVAALQSGSEWLLAVKNFRGVKLSQLLPVVFAAFLALRDICRPKELLRGGKLPIVILSALFILCCVGFFLLRTGNAAAAVSIAEQRFRAWLENVLIVRPRTKEFCVGWPCLALCLMAIASRRRRLAIPFFILSSVSVSSVVNTFCHSRAPVWLSSVRSLLGALLGCLIGTLLICVFNALVRKDGSE